MKSTDTMKDVSHSHPNNVQSVFQRGIEESGFGEKEETEE